MRRTWALTSGLIRVMSLIVGSMPIRLAKSKQNASRAVGGDRLAGHHIGVEAQPPVHAAGPVRFRTRRMSKARSDPTAVPGPTSPGRGTASGGDSSSAGQAAVVLGGIDASAVRSASAAAGR